jgi:ketosteroid isomerase-like protein
MDNGKPSNCKLRNLCAAVLHVAFGTVFSIGVTCGAQNDAWPTDPLPEQNGTWKLVHRHESHRYEPIGKQLSESGGPNAAISFAAKPSPELTKTINELEAAWVYGMLTRDETKMKELLDDSIRYVHVTGSVTDKKQFMKELLGGYTETYFLDTTMRQFGDTVLVLHRAQYRLDGGPEQSPGECMHAWAKRGDRWVQVGRQSTRFEAY